jgi:hypothetical protein
MLRRLTHLKKALGRLVRRTFHRRKDYPETFERIEQTLKRLRVWIRQYTMFWDCPAFQRVLHTQLQRLQEWIQRLQAVCRPDVKPGKRRTSRRWQTYRTMCQGLARMLAAALAAAPPAQVVGLTLNQAFETAFRTAFEQEPAPTSSVQRSTVSHRGEHSLIFPWTEPTGYQALVQDARRFRVEVLVPLEHRLREQGRQLCCHAPHYTLVGYRSKARKPLVIGGQQREVPIRLIRCDTCGTRFSLLPSFLAREKHVALDLIGHVVRKLTLFGQSFRATLSDLELLLPGGHSPQTLQDWLGWFGTPHPAQVLAHAGITGSGYFQEDEGVEDEAGLRTYTVAMVEPTTLLVWHLDYVDHVDAETLAGSFTAFLRHLDFTVVGVTKDRWEPATKALKSVFHGLWLAFCHRHELKKWREALSAYQQVTHASVTTCQALYRRIATVLDTAESATVLRLKLTGVEHDEPAFTHPLLQPRMQALRTYAVRYTCHHKRLGLTKTTSIVDNFLQQVKRKLRQVESFRDQRSTRLFFRAMATVRNFVPFLPGAKHAHQSPFMLAQGDTFDLPWAQVLNMHDAFLFNAEVS